MMVYKKRMYTFNKVKMTLKRGFIAKDIYSVFNNQI